MNWLETNEEFTSSSLERRLMELTHEAEREVNALSLSSETPQLLREVLEEKQRKGSEAMYICGEEHYPRLQCHSRRIGESCPSD